MIPKFTLYVFSIAHKETDFLYGIYFLFIVETLWATV